jgi:hypothetical protein
MGCINPPDVAVGKGVAVGRGVAVGVGGAVGVENGVRMAAGVATSGNSDVVATWSGLTTVVIGSAPCTVAVSVSLGVSRLPGVAGVAGTWVATAVVGASSDVMI